MGPPKCGIQWDCTGHTHLKPAMAESKEGEKRIAGRQGTISYNSHMDCKMLFNSWNDYMNGCFIHKLYDGTVKF